MGQQRPNCTSTPPPKDSVRNFLLRSRLLPNGDLMMNPNKRTPEESSQTVPVPIRLFLRCRTPRPTYSSCTSRTPPIENSLPLSHTREASGPDRSSFLTERVGGQVFYRTTRFHGVTSSVCPTADLSVLATPRLTNGSAGLPPAGINWSSSGAAPYPRGQKAFLGPNPKTNGQQEGPA